MSQTYAGGNLTHPPNWGRTGKQAPEKVFRPEPGFEPGRPGPSATHRLSQLPIGSKPFNLLSSLVLQHFTSYQGGSRYRGSNEIGCPGPKSTPKPLCMHRESARKVRGPVLEAGVNPWGRQSQVSNLQPNVRKALALVHR